VCSLSTSRSRDLAVGEALGEQAHDLALARRELVQRRAARRGQDPPRPLRFGRGAQREQAIAGQRGLALAHVDAAESDQARRELEPGPRGLVRRAAALEAVHRVLEQPPRALALAAAGGEHALGKVGARPQRRGAHTRRDLTKCGERRAGALELAARDVRVDEQLDRRRALQVAVVGDPAQQPLDEVDRRQRAPLVERQARAAQQRRRRRAGERRDVLAPLAGPLEIQRGDARRDQQAERPRARDRDGGLALQRRGGGLVETPHALLDPGAAHERRALEREAEHLEVRDAHRRPSRAASAAMRVAVAVSPAAWAK
jgi:hypothetical protein